MSIRKYGEFSWEIKRRKGKLFAMINRNGFLYCQLELNKDIPNANIQVREYIDHLAMLELEK